MKRNRTGYYIKEGFTSIFTHGFMSFASVCIIVACLIIMGSFSLLALNVDAIINRFEDENIILAYVDDTYTPEQSRALESELLALDNVSSVDFISKDEAMSSFVSDYDNQEMFDDLDSSILRDRYAIYLEDISLIEQTQQSVENVDGIVKVNAHLDIASGFITVRNIVSVVSLVLVAILLIVSLFIMSNTIKLTTFDRREEIAIMKMVGAKNSFIRWPFVFQGFILGIFGAAIAFFAQWGIYILITGKIISRYSLSFISVIPFTSVALPLGIVFAVIGFLVGVGGSAVAIRNYLKV